MVPGKAARFWLTWMICAVWRVLGSPVPKTIHIAKNHHVNPVFVGRTVMKARMDGIPGADGECWSPDPQEGTNVGDGWCAGILVVSPGARQICASQGRRHDGAAWMASAWLCMMRRRAAPKWDGLVRGADQHVWDLMAVRRARPSPLPAETYRLLQNCHTPPPEVGERDGPGQTLHSAHIRAVAQLG